MLKILSYVGLIIIIAGLAFQNIQLQNRTAELSEKVKQLGTELGKEKALEKHLEDKVNQEQSELQRQLQVRESDLQAMFQQLTVQRTQLDQLKQHLDQLKAQNHGRDTSALQIQIQKDQDRLKNLKSRLDEYQNAEKDAAAEGNQSLNQQKSQTSLLANDLNKKIKLQQEALKDTDKQLNFWKKRNHDINQYNKLSELNKQKEDQQEQLVSLQADKKNLQFSENQKDKQIKGTMAQEKEELKDTEGQIRQQIRDTEKDLNQLRSEVSKEGGVKSHFENELRAAQSDYDQQKIKVLNLTNEYERKRSELEQLKK